MITQHQLIIFWLDNQQFALDLNHTSRVERIVKINPLPETPNFIMGTINYHGEFIPVVDLRIIFNLPCKQLELNDILIIANTSTRKVAIWVDRVHDIVELPDNKLNNKDKVLVNNQFIEGTAKLNNEIILIHNIDTFIKSQEYQFQKIKLNKNIRKKKIPVS